MRTHGYLIALNLISVATVAHARDVREDPFAYDEREDERRREKEEIVEAEGAKQSFGSAGDFSISFERLVGYARTSWVFKQPGPDAKGTVDHFGGLISPGGGLIGFSAPRVAFDYFVSRGVSLGGSFGYGANAGDDPQKMRLITIAPRFGYALMFGEVVGIWPRVGPTYQLVLSDPENSWLLAGGGELPLIFVAGEHAAFQLGPRLDWAFLGERDPEKTAESDVKKNKLRAMEYGFSVGVSVFF